jgi:hypothetical protein
LALLLVYCAASLFHYAHNAVFLDEYPNMPAWLSPARVYAAWLGVTAVGVIGYLLYRGRYRLVGLIVLAVYGALGLDGLAHYRLAPVTAHTWGMNLSIWFEVSAALAVLAAVARTLVSQARTHGVWI